MSIFDAEKAQVSLKRLDEADLDVAILTRDERENLVAIIEDWWQQQGWDLEELRQSVQQNERGEPW